MNVILLHVLVVIIIFMSGCDQIKLPVNVSAPDLEDLKVLSISLPHYGKNPAR